MSLNKPKAAKISALSLAVAALLMTSNLHAGVINNANPDTAPGAFLGDCGAVGSPTACVGALNLDNVDVNLVRVIDGSTFSTSFNKATGAYDTMAVGDSFVSVIKDSVYGMMAKLTGKVWPVGEPVGIKAVINDPKVKSGKPANCLINTSFLSATDSADAAAANLDTAHPRPVICSSPFQTHKRFKFAMLPATVAGVANGADGNGIDLVLNASDDGTLRPYQVFSKIDNYTGKRLKGYKIVVGKGVGAAFRSASELGIADKLHISLGVAEGSSKGKNAALNGSDLFDDDGLATFSHGLFGAPDKHFTVNGFFDSRTAGFNVAQTCAMLSCTNYTNPYATGAALVNSDTIYSTSVLPNNYAAKFGDWLPDAWAPKGIFWDSDNDPTTDADLVAYWDGTQWVKNFDSGFTPVTQAELNTWANNPLYAIKGIEDVLNLGINYIVKVGDGIGPNFTVRMIPVVALDQTQPIYVGTAPTALVNDGTGTITDPNVPIVINPDPVEPGDTDPVYTVAPTVASGGGGGCTTANGDAPFDPALPLLAALGLMGLGLRRLRRD